MFLLKSFKGRQKVQLFRQEGFLTALALFLLYEDCELVYLPYLNYRLPPGWPAWRHSLSD